jgi:hypothetical protein
MSSTESALSGGMIWIREVRLGMAFCRIVRFEAGRSFATDLACPANAGAFVGWGMISWFSKVLLRTMDTTRHYM